MVLIACGRKEIVVQIAANNPKIVIVFKIIILREFLGTVKVNYMLRKSFSFALLL